MRRIATWLLFGAVAALGLAAAVDALRGDGEVVVAERSTTTISGLAEQPKLAVRQLREAGVQGVLTYSDDECRLHAVSLPDLEPVKAPSFQMCRPLTDSGGLGVSDGNVVWAGLGFGVIQEVISQEALSRALRGAGRAAPGGYQARQVVSLGDDLIAVVADSVGTARLGADDAPLESLAVLFEGERFLTVAALLGENDIIRPSPGGRFFAVLSSREPTVRAALTVYERNGHVVPLPALANPHAIAWSPNDRWTAVVTPTSIYVFPSDRRQNGVIRIPLAVQDLDWTDESVAAVNP